MPQMGKTINCNSRIKLSQAQSSAETPVICQLSIDQGQTDHRHPPEERQRCSDWIRNCVMAPVPPIAGLMAVSHSCGHAGPFSGLPCDDVHTHV